MEQNKETDFTENTESNSNKEIIASVPTIVRNTLSSDIDYCKERILESQRTIENIQCLLKLVRYSSVKEFYGNQRKTLTNADGQSLPDTLACQHPTVIAASSQLLKLQSRPKRQAAQKIQLCAKTKLEKTKTKTNDGPIFSNNEKAEVSNPSISKSTNTYDSTAVAVANSPPVPVLNASRSSRFYTKYKLLIGNTSQYIGDDNSDSCTHTWCIYVRRPENEPSASEIIQKVRFRLDPSYKPNDVIEVVAEPFSLTKRGWGEFPITIEMFFKSKDKPVTFVHNLKLDKLKTGRYCLELETAVEVALDINPKASEKVHPNVSKEANKVLSEDAAKSELAKTNIKNIVKYNKSYNDSESEYSFIKPFNVKRVSKKRQSNSCNSDNYIYLKEPFLIHCIQTTCNKEYVIRIPEKHNCVNLKYPKTQEKVTYLNQPKHEVKIENNDPIKKLPSLSNTAVINTKQILKRKCSETIQHSSNKVKVVEALRSPKSKDSLLIPLQKSKDNIMIRNNISKHEATTAQMTLLKNSAKVGTPMIKVPQILKGQSSLLKRNNLMSDNKFNKNAELTAIKSSESMKFRNNSLLSNTSILTKQVAENPKIIIVRQGNSVLTKQNTIVPQTKEIRLSPERKLLGSRKNSINKKIFGTLSPEGKLLGSRKNPYDKKVFDFASKLYPSLKSETFSTFDKDLDNLKPILDKINIKHVIEYALRRIPLYVQPGSTHDIYFDVPTLQQFSNYSLVKQITLEIKRSKYIYNILKSLYTNLPVEWDYVSILKYSRDQGYIPKEHKYWSNICAEMEKNSLHKERLCDRENKKNNSFISYSDGEKLINYFDKLFVSTPKDMHDCNEDIDIESLSSPSKCVEKKSDTKNQRLPLLYGDKAIAQHIISSSKTLGINFKPEELIAGVDHPSALEVMCSVLDSFVSNVVRKSLGICRADGSSIIKPEHIFSTLLSRPEFDMLTNQNLALS